MLHFSIPFFMRRRDPKDEVIEHLRLALENRDADVDALRDKLSAAVRDLQTERAKLMNQIDTTTQYVRTVRERDITIRKLRTDIEVLEANVQCLRRKLSRPKKLGGKRGEPSRPTP